MMLMQAQSVVVMMWFRGRIHLTSYQSCAGKAQRNYSMRVWQYQPYWKHCMNNVPFGMDYDPGQHVSKNTGPSNAGVGRNTQAHNPNPLH